MSIDPVPLDLPPPVHAMAARGPEWVAWVDALPRTAAAVLDAWQLDLDGTATCGHCSLVLPVRAEVGLPAVLKLGFPDEESEHEPVALQRWGGDGTVRLLRADPSRRAMLLERLHGTDLSQVGDLEACETVASLYARLHVPAPPQLRSLASYVADWADRLERLPRGAPVPRRLVEQAVSLGRDLAADPGTDGVLVHTDLHYGNVLAADREPWLVIDPKPLSGDPHYEVAPLLWNRWEELTGDVRGGVRRRFHATIDAAGLDEERARDWVVVRMLVNALWEIEEPDAGGQDVDFLTMCVTLAKAVQD